MSKYLSFLLRESKIYFYCMLSYYILFYAAEVPFFNIFEIFFTLTIANLGVFLFIYICIFIFPVYHKTVIACTTLIVFYILYKSSIYKSLKYLVSSINDDVYNIVFKSLTLLTFFIIILLSKKKITVVPFLNIFFSVFVTLQLFNTITVIFHTKKIVNEIQIVKNISNSPDVYIIVLDGYANNSSLKKYWHFDNSDFSNFLTQNGFDIINNSKSNYNYTYATFASMLNYQYLQYPEFEKIELTSRKIHENNFITNYQKANYEIFNYSFFNFKTKSNELENYYYLKFPKSFYKFLLTKVASSGVIKSLYSVYTTAFKNTKITKSQVERIPRDSAIVNEFKKAIKYTTKKKLVLMHYMSLHPPYKNINQSKIDSFLLKPKDFQTLGSRKYDSLFTATYLKELKTANTITKDLINLIDKSNSIILVMSDHGFRYLPGLPKKDIVSEAFKNFEAIYFPKKLKNTLPNNIGPINLFRLISNNCIGTTYPIIQEKQYYTNYKRL